MVAPTGKATSTIGEVTYRDGNRLTAVVARDLSRHGTMADILTDILATASTQDDAIGDIRAVGERLGLEITVDHGGDGAVVIVTPVRE